MRVVREVQTPRRVLHLDPPEKGIAKVGFQREVRRVLHENGYENFIWGKDALELLRQAAEDYMVETFEKAYGVQLTIRALDLTRSFAAAQWHDRLVTTLSVLMT